MMRPINKVLVVVKFLANCFNKKKNVAPGRQFLLDMLPKNSIGAEIGVHKGTFSTEILNTVNPKKLYLIDPWEHQTSEVYKTAWYGGAAEGGQKEMDERYSAILEKFDHRVEGGQVEIRRGYSEQILGAFLGEYLDWVYIDGNHLYEFVKKDLELSLKKVKVGGYICGDDYVEGGLVERRGQKSG